MPAIRRTAIATAIVVIGLRVLAVIVTEPSPMTTMLAHVRLAA